ncbi:putative vacuolar protein sorting protein [Penicillium digitatum]|uniref:Mucin n=3 Tax=Penicillium digitatum TaxID=36651 RepID=K9FSV6_PEND2|nr:hypothetical protein PDIP_42200 [Penicillium digitatum Pd1]EKV11577.1 hypothetical protein PDIG_49330 [Penicillium digitatum PHI26]EKV14827.1 hypothetical protein PDIP_42200 [Penicillium digitatum Pd1]KAG0152725.1 hypothetical protein PDIDSM_2530 [Penicillium digitatum]QQK46400.1 putative vacuolar protein sorting protein [Penicillium digitatum]
MSTEEFESLPPAVRRKFFSNVERLRIRLAQSDHSSPSCSTSSYQTDNRVYQAPRLGSDYHSLGLRNGSRKRGLEKRSSPSTKLRKPGSLQLAYLAAQADSQCFHTLPAKIQQKLFSPEERRRLRNTYRQSLIYDAADEAYCRDSGRDFGNSRSPFVAPPSQTTVAFVQPSTIFYPDSESDEEDPNMDQTFHDSFRWIDEDGDLDLSLDEYHAHVSDAATKKQPRSSFRRSLSFSNHLRKTLEITPASAWGLPRVSQSQPPTPLPNRTPESRPSSNHRFQHAPKSLASSIDPCAQYYQDPDARLKLRVYLASPQKFDEAIEFGFPSLDHNNKESFGPEPITPQPASPKFTLVNSDFGTFFEDDDGTMVGSPGGSVESEPIPSSVLTHRDAFRPFTESSTLLQRPQSWMPGAKGVPQRLPGNREMTLKMTLTRPDLRTNSPTPSASSKGKEDPLRLAELPPADRSQSIWDSDLDDQGMVRKMWRKLRCRV